MNSNNVNYINRLNNGDFIVVQPTRKFSIFEVVTAKELYTKAKVIKPVQPLKLTQNESRHVEIPDNDDNFDDMFADDN